MAEREGFEPPGPCGPAVFKTAAIDHSATSPLGGYFLRETAGLSSFLGLATGPRDAAMVPSARLLLKFRVR